MYISEIERIIAEVDVWAEVVDDDEVISVYTHTPALGMGELAARGYDVVVTPYGFDVVEVAPATSAAYWSCPQCGETEQVSCRCG